MSAQDIAIALEHQAALGDRIVALLLSGSLDVDTVDAAVRLSEEYRSRYPETDYERLRGYAMLSYYAKGFGLEGGDAHAAEMDHRASEGEGYPDKEVTV